MVGTGEAAGVGRGPGKPTPRTYLRLYIQALDGVVVQLAEARTKSCPYRWICMGPSTLLRPSSPDHLGGKAERSVSRVCLASRV